VTCSSARDGGCLIELDAAFLLNVGLFDRVHIPLELRDLLSIRAVALNQEGGWPEQDYGGGCGYRVVGRVLVLSPRCDRGARGDSRSFLAQLRARKPFDIGGVRRRPPQCRQSATRSPPRPTPRPEHRLYA
jgi:hypothetical protein